MVTTKGTVFVLGAIDPEMREIENILKWQECDVRYAMKDGKRVHPGNAYQADEIGLEALLGIEQIVLIECEPIFISAMMQVVSIDHHRPGDPGYGMSAAKFWQASSLGQLCDFLGVSQECGSQDNLVLAAMDHCPAAAIRGECPGVSAQEVLERKVAEIAAGTKSSPHKVMGRVGYYEGRLMDAPALWIGNEPAISDLRSEYLGEGYSLDLLAAQVAALAGGYTVLLRHRDKAGDPEKLSISGHATPALIQAFKEQWAPAQGLVGIYGVPSRGYAGGYLP